MATPTSAPALAVLSTPALAMLLLAPMIAPLHSICDAFDFDDAVVFGACWP